MRHTLIALLAATSCCAAMAQAPAPAVTPVGKVAEVKGLVTMSIGSNVATVQPQTPVFDGARFVTGSAGGAELRFDDGCVVKLNPNQVYTADSAQGCADRIAAVLNLGDNVAGGTMLARYVVPAVGFLALTGLVSRLPEPQITPTPR